MAASRTVGDAVRFGAQLVERGADLVDVGGESTRPGALRIDEEIELGRVIPVIRGLAESGVACSVDTTRARVATAAIDAGAVAVNDVSGGMADPAMARMMADNGLPWVLMHWRAHSVTMADHAVYGDVVADVIDELSARVDAALAAGVAHDAIMLDPGLGFAKTGAHNWVLLRELPRLVALGFPVLVGASRKRFLPPSVEKPGSRRRSRLARPVDRGRHVRRRHGRWLGGSGARHRDERHRRPGRALMERARG